MNLKKKEKKQAAPEKNLEPAVAALLRKIYLKAENLNTAVSLR